MSESTIHQTSPAGIAFIESFESLKLEAYPDPAAGWALPSIGFGHTGPEVHQGLTIDRQTADLWLSQDVAKSELIVNHWVAVPLTQGQFDPLVSLIFNVGPGNPGHRDGIIWLTNGTHSTLLRKLLALDYAGASAEFPRWCLPKNLPGILRRRLAEQAVFNRAAA